MGGEEPEEEGSPQGGQGAPPGEDDDGHGDPALAAADPLLPARSDDQGQICSGHSGEKSSCREGGQAHPGHRNAHGVGRGRVFSAGAHHEPPAGAGQDEPQGQGHGETNVDQGVLLKEHRAEERDILEKRNGRLLHAQAYLSDEAAAQVVGQARAQDGQGDAGEQLIGSQAYGEEPVQAGQGRAHCSGCGKGQDRAAGCMARVEAGQGAQEHHAFLPEVDHPGAFGQHLALGGQKHRHGGFERKRKEEGEVVHEPGFSSTEVLTFQALPVAGAGRSGACGRGSPGINGGAW